MRFQLAIGCEISGEEETGEQYAIEQCVFAARVVHAWQRCLGALGGADVAREVNSTTGTCEVGVDAFVVAVNAAFQQFAGFGCELLDEQVLEVPLRRWEFRRVIKIEMTQAICVAKNCNGAPEIFG